jgi:hypothetical protein
MGEKRNLYTLWVGKPKGKRPLGRPRYRWMQNFKIDFAEIGCCGVNWIGLAQGRDKWGALVNAIMNLWVPLNSDKLSSGCTTGGHLSSAQLHRVS